MCDFAIRRKLIAAGLPAALGESLDGECCFHAPIACGALDTQFCKQFLRLVAQAGFVFLREYATRAIYSGRRGCAN